MVVLKKIRAATLIETLVASVIIVIVFMIASMSLNNVFKSSLKTNDDLLQNRIRELTYLVKNDKVIFPFSDNTEYWEISLNKTNGVIELNVFNKETNKEFHKVIDYEN